MAKNDKLLTNQHSIFASDETGEFKDLNIQPDLLTACTLAIKKAKQNGRSRDHIVDRMNALLPSNHKKITRRQLDSWMATSKEFHYWPAYALPAFCKACQCDAPLQVMAFALGFKMIGEREQATLKLAEIKAAKARLDLEEAELLKQISEKFE